MNISLADHEVQEQSLALMTRFPYGEDMALHTTPHTIQTPTPPIIARTTPQPAVGHEMSARELAEAVAVDGFEIHAAAVAAVVAEANLFAQSDVLAAVALDPHQPTVARERAFGRLVAAYYRAIDRQRATDRGADPSTTSERFTVAA
jgi:hypothetical protein